MTSKNMRFNGKLYKFLDRNGACPETQVKWTLDKWMPPIEGPLTREDEYAGGGRRNNGYPLYSWEDIFWGLNARAFEAEWRGERADRDGIVVREARIIKEVTTWNARTQRLFICDCAEHVLSIFEKECLDDKRVRQAIETARRYANGEATREELEFAEASARNAEGWISGIGRRVARVAALAAAAAPETVMTAWGTAGRAAFTWWSDTQGKERKWQKELLYKYFEGEI